MQVDFSRGGGGGVRSQPSNYAVYAPGVARVKVRMHHWSFSAKDGPVVYAANTLDSRL